jgi:tetratricopeptide (TPR) repeat protein
MTKFRFARTSLLAAVLGLNFAPAVLGMSPVLAAEEKAPEAAKQETIRPELYKLIDPNQVKELMAAKNYAEIKNRINQGAALPNLTPFETFILNDARVRVASASEDIAMLLPALEAMIESGRMTQRDKLNFIEATGNTYFQQKNYDKAITWYNRYSTESGDANKTRLQVLRSLYLKNDFNAVKAETRKDIAAHEAAGQAPTVDELKLLQSAAAQGKDMPTYLSALEMFVKYYPTEANWNELLNRTRGKDGYNMRLDVDMLRLKKTVLPKLEGDDLYDLADLDVLAGFFTEAKAAMDAGFEQGSLGTGPDAAKHKALRDKANKGAADDAKNVDSGVAAATKSKDGIGLVNLGYVYVTMGQFDKGLDLMQKGIAKGVSKNPEDAKLRLGYAYVMAGKKDEAAKILATVNPADGRGDLARYWMLWANRPAAPAAAAAAK